MSLEIKFESADLPELKDTEIKFDGSNRKTLTIGEGEENDYQIPNDKKMLGTQLMISVDDDNKFYVQDMS